MRQPNFQLESPVPRGPSPTESYSSSDGDPMDQDSPSPCVRAANRANITHQTSGRSGPDSDGSPVSMDNSDLGNTASFISDHSAISMTAAIILYTCTEDESIVNTFLILLLNTLGLGSEEVTAEWSMKRWVRKHPFGSGSLEARTDGCLRSVALEALWLLWR
ncbi:D-serine dehydratase domain-containing protein [Histoplasma ohiense]|nr:D-serine dehydratase domain-containing protein [Histoplasma ohiense (nom. inval.)]